MLWICGHTTIVVTESDWQVENFTKQADFFVYVVAVSILVMPTALQQSAASHWRAEKLLDEELEDSLVSLFEFNRHGVTSI